MWYINYYNNNKIIFLKYKFTCQITINNEIYLYSLNYYKQFFLI